MPSGEEEIREEENKIIERDDGCWLVDGLLNVDEFQRILPHRSRITRRRRRLVHKTMGGLLNVLFGRIQKELDKSKMGWLYL